MAKLTRYTQQIFGSNASTGQIAQFGSLAGGTPLTYSGSTATPTLIQAAGAFINGWFSAVVGSYSPAIEDMNALFWLLSYQIAYMMQEGIPEWDAGTTYYVGSLVNDGSGNIYKSLTNNNLNNAVSPTSAFWGEIAPSPEVAGAYATTTIQTYQNDWFFYNYSNGAACIIQLPNPSIVGQGFGFWVKDNIGTFGTTIAGTLSGQVLRYGSESIEGVASNYNMLAPYGVYGFWTDGTNWYRK